MKRAAWITLVVATGPLPRAHDTKDPVPALVIASILIPAAAVWLGMNRNTTWVIDAPSEIPGRNRFTSYAVFVEATIQQCQQRLAELKPQEDKAR